MTGERLAWFKLARRLNMSVQRVQQETTSSEFVDHQTVAQMEWNEKRPELWYLAQIAREVRAVLAKNPNRIKVKDFMMEFKEEGEELTREQYEQRSKSFWAATLGPMVAMANRAKNTMEGIFRGGKQ